MFSTVSAENATTIADALNRPMESRPSMVNIVSNWKLTHNNLQSSGNDDDASTEPNSSPSTAVAMMILYSITGLITALFLVIIITGALRAHRHPERYGTRDILGRPVQSRARGIARAMLDTIPIVKFGERNETTPKPATAEDVELGDRPAESRRDGGEQGETRSVGPSGETSAPAPNGNEASRSSGNDLDSSVTNADSADQSVTVGAIASPPRVSTDSNQENPTGPAVAAGAAGTQDDETLALGCSICTDDFEHGQDIRVLPCNHKFHPECVDPWLLNVSGTCPLWYVYRDARNDLILTLYSRIELRSRIEDPNQPGTTGAQGESGDLSAPLEPPASNRASNRLSSTFRDVLHLRRVRDAPAEERLATLRQLRQSTDQQRQQQQQQQQQHLADDQQGGNTTSETAHRALAVDPEVDQGRSRLSRRFHDVFRIRTQSARPTEP
jgi:hypothetical protein